MTSQVQWDLGDYNRPDVKDALQSYITKVKNANKPLGYHVIQSDALFSIEKIQQGYSLIALASISFSLETEPNQNLKKLKNLNEKSASLEEVGF